MGISEKTARPGVVVGVLAFGGTVAAITQTAVVPIIGQLPQLLHTSAANASWVITVTLLVGAVFTPVAGKLGDLYGKHRMLLVSGGFLIVGAAIAAMSSSLVPMLIGRGIQGMGVGLIPLGISLMRDVLPAERLGSSIALMSASLGVGGALGLPVSAAVAQYASWRVLFWAAAALSVLIVVLIATLVPAEATRGDAGGRFDFVGAAGLGAGLVFLLLPVSKGAGWGWSSATTLGLFAASAVTLAAWGWWELRTSDPLVDLRTTARPQVLLTNAASVLVGFAMYGQALIVPQLMQLPAATGHGMGQTMLGMGLWMAPGGLMMMLLSPAGAKLSAARGPKVTLAVGALIIAVGYGSSAVLMGSTWGLMTMVCITNIGVGLAYGAMPALIMGAVPLSETASANSINTLMRSLGTSVSAAVVGVVLANMTTDFAGHAVPSEAGFHVGLLIGAAVALVAAGTAMTIPRRPAEPADLDSELATLSTRPVSVAKA
ncbi:MFS transporter [Nocardia sp. NPDC056541]|uniref:MFS transporter n=1 Tax=Nocardia sp. NPDC056541 TaxID=3345860 RepID=UPI00367097AA